MSVGGDLFAEVHELEDAFIQGGREEGYKWVKNNAWWGEQINQNSIILASLCHAS